MANSILISCLDKPGLIYEITKIFHQNQVNIESLEEHVEAGHFFIRVQWGLEAAQKDWEKLFCEFIKTHQASFRIRLAEPAFKVVLFCSKPLHCLLNILHQVFFNELPFDVVAVISNHKEAQGFVENLGFPFHHCPTESLDRNQHEENILKVLSLYDYDCIGLARYMRVLSANFLNQITVPMINVHHSFLPSFKGADPYQQAFDKGVKVIGATAHYVTEDLDEGPIIDQEILKVNHLSDKLALSSLGKQSEKQVFAKALCKESQNKIVVHKGKTIVFN